MKIKTLLKLKFGFGVKVKEDLQNPLSIIFTTDSVQQRINTFKQVKLDDASISQNTLIQAIPSIQHPSYLKFDSAKNLSLFIKQNRIPSNIRILHALAHIEYNAFMAYTHTYFTLSSQIKDPAMRLVFKQEIKGIALDQGDHYGLLNNRLEVLGWKYGSIPVIDQLCMAIEQTKESLLERMARISLLHEGKGMKAIGKLISQMRKEKDEDSIRILQIIEKQEVHHFENGVKWFKYVCNEENKQFEVTCQELMQRREFKHLGLEDILATAKKYQ